MQKLTTARKSKGWSITKTAQQVGISEQSIRNLEGQGATRTTNPANVQASTMVRLLELFPPLDIKDFVGRTSMSVRRKTR